MKKIVITNAYTWYNKGDAGILLGIVNTLKEIYSDDIEITVLSFTPEEDKKRYCVDETIVDVKSNILNPFPYKKTKTGKIFAIAKLVLKMISIYLGLKLFKNIVIKKIDSLKSLSEADEIIVCGGGFLGGKKYDSLMHVFQIYVNTLFKVPVILLGASVEPMKSGLIKYYTEKTLLKLDEIYARETITYSILEGIIAKDKLFLIPDMAFMLEEGIVRGKYMSNLSEKAAIYVGITVRDWNFPNLPDRRIAQENYEKSLADAMEFIYDKYDAHFIFIPQVIAETNNDLLTAVKIQERLCNPEIFKIMDDDMSPLEIKGFISNLDFFIGTRMHSNIFATSMNCPTLAIAYEKKTNGIMETVGMTEYILEIDDITTESIIQKFDKLVLNKNDIKSNLSKNIITIKENVINTITKKS